MTQGKNCVIVGIIPTTDFLLSCSTLNYMQYSVNKIWCLILGVVIKRKTVISFSKLTKILSTKRRKIEKLF